MINVCGQMFEMSKEYRAGANAGVQYRLAKHTRIPSRPRNPNTKRYSAWNAGFLHGKFGVFLDLPEALHQNSSADMQFTWVGRGPLEGANPHSAFHQPILIAEHLLELDTIIAYGRVTPINEFIESLTGWVEEAVSAAGGHSAILYDGSVYHNGPCLMVFGTESDYDRATRLELVAAAMEYADARTLSGPAAPLVAPPTIIPGVDSAHDQWKLYQQLRQLYGDG